jgi:phosphatidylserine/phosphatidylglycerophosphate/cardiolipin synthase-like enzyme
MRDRMLIQQAKRLPGAPATPTFGPSRVLARNGTFGVEHLALEKPTYHNKVRLHLTPDESRLAILDSIKNAKQSFWLEMFIWHDDQSGREVAQALIDRKQLANERGEPFDIKVLIDWSGLRDSTNLTKDTEILKLLREGGIDVREFNVGIVDPTATGA